MGSEQLAGRNEDNLDEKGKMNPKENAGADANDNEGNLPQNRNEDNLDKKEKVEYFNEDGGAGINEYVEKLPEDIYTLLFVAPYFSKTYLIGLMTFALQIAVLCLFLFNMIDLSDNLKIHWKADLFRKLKIPLRVSVIVSVCQYLAVIIAWLDQLEELATFRNVLDIKKFEHHPKHKRFSKFRFLIANTLRQLVSIFVLGVTFLFVIQSDSAIDLFLNFVAVTFIGKIDNTLYLLLKGGIICAGSDLKKYIANVGKIRMISRSKKKSCPKNLMAFGLLLGLLGMLTYVMYMLQWSNFGQELKCQNFELNVQHHTLFNFFDKVLPYIPNGASHNEYWVTKYGHKQLDYREFNGRYTSLDKSNEILTLTEKRPVYYQEGPERSDSMAPGGQISYCGDSQRWIFSIPGISKDVKADKEGCEWLMRSTVTEAYALEDVSTEGWEIWSGPQTGLVQTILDQTFLQCSQCTDDTDCNYHGECVKDYGIKKKCVCGGPDWTGNTCNQCSGCKHLYLILDSKDEESHNSEDEESHDSEEEPYKFTILEDVMAYGRSVYVDDKCGYTLSYTGAKFIIMGACDGHCYNERQCNKIQGCYYDEDGCYNMCENNNHFNFSSYHSLWDSEPIIESQYTNRENPSMGLEWTVSKNKCIEEEIKEELPITVMCKIGLDKCVGDSGGDGNNGGSWSGSGSGDHDSVCDTCKNEDLDVIGVSEECFNAVVEYSERLDDSEDPSYVQACLDIFVASDVTVECQGAVVIEYFGCLSDDNTAVCKDCASEDISTEGISDDCYAALLNYVFPGDGDHPYASKCGEPESGSNVTTVCQSAVFDNFDCLGR